MIISGVTDTHLHFYLGCSKLMYMWCQQHFIINTTLTLKYFKVELGPTPGRTTAPLILIVSGHTRIYTCPDFEARPALTYVPLPLLLTARKGIVGNIMIIVTDVDYGTPTQPHKLPVMDSSMLTSSVPIEVSNSHNHKC